MLVSGYNVLLHGKLDSWATLVCQKHMSTIETEDVGRDKQVKERTWKINLTKK